MVGKNDTFMTTIFFSLYFLMPLQFQVRPLPTTSEEPLALSLAMRFLKLVSTVEVLESLTDTGNHGLLTLADPDTGLSWH